MLGRLGFSVPLHIHRHPSPEEDQIKSVFLSGGKMHQERQGVIVGPQNQTISAIIVLGRVAAGERLFHAEMREREARLGRRHDWDEFSLELERARLTTKDPRRRPLRVVVHENPYARIPLPSDSVSRPLGRALRWPRREGSTVIPRQ